MNISLSQVQSIATSATGQLLASGSADGSVRVWEVSTGRCLKTWALQSRVKCVAWCPNQSLDILAVAYGSSLLLLNTGKTAWIPNAKIPSSNNGLSSCLEKSSDLFSKKFRLFDHFESCKDISILSIKHLCCPAKVLPMPSPPAKNTNCFIVLVLLPSLLIRWRCLILLGWSLINSITSGLGSEEAQAASAELLRAPKQGDSSKQLCQWQEAERKGGLELVHQHPVQHLSWHSRGDYFTSIAPSGSNQAGPKPLLIEPRFTSGVDISTFWALTS